jgi:hypothetical protein
MGRGQRIGRRNGRIETKGGTAQLDTRGEEEEFRGQGRIEWKG